LITKRIHLNDWLYIHFEGELDIVENKEQNDIRVLGENNGHIEDSRNGEVNMVLCFLII
jgi:hypothetical protein